MPLHRWEMALFPKAEKVEEKSENRTAALWASGVVEPQYKQTICSQGLSNEKYVWNNGGVLQQEGDT